MKRFALAISFFCLYSLQVQAMINHIVTFKYKANVSREQKEEVIKRFLNLKDVCLKDGANYILSIQAGRANSKEGVDLGMEQGFIVKFRNASDRDYYVGRPLSKNYDREHDAFKAFVGPMLSTNSEGKIDGAFVFDFKVEND